jgi:ABC-type bacteriocin/lantibiotic exporter with double-glycine peptidase domain
MARPSDPRNLPGDMSPAILRSAAFNHVSFRYAGKLILHDISFSLREGELLGIRGDSGIGKTTLLNILLGFITPSSGEIMINDQLADSSELKKYWPSVSYTRQQSFFIYDTILRNITLDEKDYDASRLQQALEISGLDKLVDSFPEGLEKMITENGKNISGGQQQRVAIARAVYKDARLIVLDEPFNELDEESSREILGHMKELCAAGKLIILVTHDQKSLEACTKILSLDE